jgi:hypothetical protein
MLKAVICLLNQVFKNHYKKFRTQIIEEETSMSTTTKRYSLLSNTDFRSSQSPLIQRPSTFVERSILIPYCEKELIAKSRH